MYKRQKRLSSVPALSVILPVYNAMPWLPIAVRDMLKQHLDDDASLELVAVVDGASDGSLAFLLELATLLGEDGARVELWEPPSVPAGTESINPALVQPLRAPETEDHCSFADGHVAVTTSASALATTRIPSAAEVATSCRPEHTLLVLHYAQNRGQGAAMSLALSRCRAPVIAQMESDDERSDALSFRQMMGVLQRHPEWDGVACAVELCGVSDRERMAAYVAWQNSLLAPADLAAARFVELPALHQAAMFRRAAVDEVLASTGGHYRDGPWRGGSHGAATAAADGADGVGAADDKAAAAESSHGDRLDTPVDLWWWLAFFHSGKLCGRLESGASAGSAERGAMAP